MVLPATGGRSPPVATSLLPNSVDDRALRRVTSTRQATRAQHAACRCRFAAVNGPAVGLGSASWRSPTSCTCPRGPPRRPARGRRPGSPTAADHLAAAPSMLLAKEYAFTGDRISAERAHQWARQPRVRTQDVFDAGARLRTSGRRTAAVRSRIDQARPEHPHGACRAGDDRLRARRRVRVVRHRQAPRLHHPHPRRRALTSSIVTVPTPTNSRPVWGRGQNEPGSDGGGGRDDGGVSTFISLARLPPMNFVTRVRRRGARGRWPRPPGARGPRGAGSRSRTTRGPRRAGSRGGRSPLPRTG